jgi:repressor LexA
MLSEDYRRENNSVIQKPSRIIHLYDIPVSAGHGEWLEESTYEELEVGSEVPETADFGVRVEGDSMEPQFVNGQIVWIHKMEQIEDGEIGIFYLDGKGYIKKLQDNKKGSYLISLNKKYDPIEINENTIFRTLGKVVG